MNPSNHIQKGMRLCVLGSLATLYFLIVPTAGRNSGTWLVPTYTLGCLVAGWGVVQLLTATRGARAAHRLARVAAGLILLQIYFSPFYFWWARLPTEAFFTLNAGLLLFTILYLPLILLRLAAHLSTTADRSAFLRWTWLVQTLGVVPLLGIFCLTWLQSRHFSTAWSSELTEFFRGSLTRMVPGWILALHLLSLYRVWCCGGPGPNAEALALSHKN